VNYLLAALLSLLSIGTGVAATGGLPANCTGCDFGGRDLHGADLSNVAYVGVDGCREPVAQAVRPPVDGEGAAVAGRRELILGHRVVVLARPRRPGDGAPGEAGAGPCPLAGV